MTMTDSLPIEMATIDDAPGIMESIAACIRRMRTEHGHSPWDEVYPHLKAVEENALSHSLYVVRLDGVCIASACLDSIAPSSYKKVPWFDDGRPALIFHRLCVHPDWQRHGLGGRFIRFADELAAERGCGSIRLDAYTGTPAVVDLYERFGYRKVGHQLHFPRRPLAFECLEKRVESGGNGTATR